MSFLNQVSKSLLPHKEKKFLLALSAGLDSMALFHCFLHFREIFNFEFGVCYFHHGPTDDPYLEDYRFNAYDLIKMESQKQGVPFFSNFTGDNVEVFLNSFAQVKASEAEFRQIRYSFLEETRKENQYDLIVLAHHRDDLLETRVLRLIRGVGPGGLVAMKEQAGFLFRPLLGFSRQSLKDFLIEQKGRWLEDPSNEDSSYLRNWLRKKWLPELEEKQPGALGALARSLELLTESSGSTEWMKPCFKNNQLDLGELLTLSLESKRQVLATYIRDQGLKNYGLSHINEILKRLDTEKKSHTFKLLGRCWIVDAGRMSVQEPS